MNKLKKFLFPRPPEFEEYTLTRDERIFFAIIFGIIIFVIAVF